MLDMRKAELDMKFRTVQRYVMCIRLLTNTSFNVDPQNSGANVERPH